MLVEHARHLPQLRWMPLLRLDLKQGQTVAGRQVCGVLGLLSSMYAQRPGTRTLVRSFVRSYRVFYQYQHASRPSVHTRFQERSTSALNTDWHSLCVCTKLSFLGMPCPPVSSPVPLSSLGFRHRPGASVTLRYSPCPHGGTTLFVALAQAKSASPPRDEMPRSECK